MKVKLRMAVTFKIDLTRDTEDCAMQPREIKENIKYWLERQFEDYFDRFKIRGLRCHVIEGPTPARKK